MTGGGTVRATGFNHMSVSARNLEESVRFYEEMFGMECIPTYNFSFKAQYLRCGDQQLHVYELQETVGQYQHFALNVEDFHAVYEKALARGILDGPFGTALNEMPDGSVQMYLRDPTGNLIEVDWPAVESLDRSRLPELRRLSDRIPQWGEALQATLFLDHKERDDREAAA